MKGLFLFLAVCCCCKSSLMAQANHADNDSQKVELKTALAGIDKKLNDRQQLWLAAQSAKAKYDTIGLAQYRYDIQVLRSEKKEANIHFVQLHPGYLVSLDALKDAIGPLPDNIELYHHLFTRLNKEVRQSEAGINTKKLIDGFMTVRIGAQAPDFTAPDTAGNPVKLVGYKGKFVLVDFWASWCGPCREENPCVVDVYQHFKEKNFDILSVSLDQPGQKAAWINAIQHDHLTWKHVSDLKYWNNEVAKLYMIRSIPQNFLIDPNGKIIAKNLRGEALYQTIQALVK